MTGQTKRINRGRSHSYLLDGEKVDSVTGIIGDGLPKPALTNWAAREVATYAVDNIPLLHGLDRDAAIDLLKGAPYRDRDKAARRGTEVHKLAERLARGEEVTVPEELDGHVTSYLRFREEWCPTNEIIEFVCGSRKYRHMGTGDLMADLNGLGRCLIDLKTTRSGVFGEIALQLSGYRYSEFYLDENGREQPMPEIDWTGALWLRADGYDLLPVMTDPHIYRIFLYVQQVAHFAGAVSKEVIGNALVPETV